MPTACPRPCVRPGCPELQPCSVHGSARIRPSSTLRRQTEPGKRLYDQRAWRDASRAFLRQHPLCVECERQRVIRLAVHVDHVTPHRGDVDAFWNRENWQALCSHCHGQKTRREMQG
jgi:5-methylcytosine-specific restriction protein A